MKQFTRTITAVVLAVGIMVGGSVPAYGAFRQYEDFDNITGHIDTTVPQTLGIASPSASLTTTASAYYITGTSNPNQTLYLDGNEVGGRGIYGSFGVYAPLGSGENVFTFTQDGGAKKSVTITKGTPPVYTTDKVSSMLPDMDNVYASGDTMLLKCTAPSGAAVTAVYGADSYTLTQTANAQDGVPAVFKAEVPAPHVSIAKNVGTVKYVMSYGGSTKDFTSQGSLFLFPSGSDPLIKITDTFATIFATPTTDSDVLAVAAGGAIDYVTDQTEYRYKLGIGGWVPKESVRPALEGKVQNTLSGASFSKTAYGERYSLTGTTSPIITSWQTADKLYIKLHHTTGSASLPTGDSKLFTGATVTDDGDGVIVALDIASGTTLWGHMAEYDGNVTTIYCKYKPVGAGSSSKPLADIIVGLDAGHGGTDPGAFGTGYPLAPAEKDINYATAVAVKKRLEGLGATVIMPERKTTKSSFSDRAQASADGKADFFISLHCNSVAGNGLKPNGVEIYYFYSRSKAFADTLLSNIIAETGRTNRGVKSSTFRVTLNPLTPAVLIEMGFISNPREYDKMCSKDGIFQMANAIGNSLINMV